MKEKYTRVAAYGLVIHETKILLCRLSSQLPRWQGQWTLPGGGIDFAEAPAEAAAREIMEETGISAKIIKPVTINSYYDDRGEYDFHAIQIIYHTEYLSGELSYEVGGTTDRCQWFSFEEVNALPKVDLVNIAMKFAN